MNMNPDVETMISDLLKQIERLVQQENIRLQDDYQSEEGAPVFANMGESLRERLMVLACSLDDYLLWIKEDTAGSCLLTEIESGVVISGADPRQACLNLFDSDHEQLVVK